LVTRVTRLGFEVRIDLEIEGQAAWAQVTRGTCEQLGLQEGSRVFVVPHHARTPVGEPA
jgi:sulfate transport system ATP-binding protein